MLQAKNEHRVKLAAITDSTFGMSLGDEENN